MAFGTFFKLNRIDKMVNFWKQDKQYREFGSIFLLIFMGIAAWPLKNGDPLRLEWGIAAGCQLIIVLLIPKVLAPVYRFWMKLGAVLGFINVRILLSIIFYVMFTPISIINKLIRRDPLQRKINKQLVTYWEQRPVLDFKESMQNQF